MKDPEIHHEVLFEDEINTLKHESLFVDQAYGKRHFLFALIILLLAWGILMGRAVWMQVWQGGWYQGLAEANRLRSVPIWPRRGRILDRQNHVLADNVARFQVTLTPHDLPHDEDAWSIEVGEAARLLGRTIQDFSAYRPRTAPFYDETILAADSLTYKQAVAFAVALPHLQGFELAIRPRRRYPFSFEIQSLSHVLGYVGKLSPEEYIQDKSSGYRHVDEKGKAGVERSLEQGLRGTVGEHVSEVDARGRVKALVGDKPASDGQDIQLSLDLDLQRSTEQALSDELRAAHIDRGAAIAMDPRDGSILALVSLPAYDNNIFSGSVSSTVYQALLDNPNQPLFPRAWAGTYPSGSTVKIVISVAALAEKVITPYTTVLSVGGLKIGPWFFPDWKAGGHGVIDVRRAIAWSVNTFFYMVGGGYESFVGLGVDRLSAWMQRFGLGSKTGIDLPGEATGFVPSKNWKEQAKKTAWFVGDTYNLSIGQGDLLVTPLQVAVYTAAIANGGRLITPHLMNQPTPPRVTQLADTSVIATVQAGMRDAVRYGSARALGDLPMPVSGKTGTAQWRSDRPNHAWFTSFAPSDHPEVVVTVLLEEGVEGSRTAVPVARRILQDWWHLRQQRGGKF